MFIGISTALSSVRRFISPYVKSGLKLYYRFLNRDDNPISHASTGSTSFVTDDYVTIDGVISSVSSNTSGTISCWVKPNDGQPSAIESMFGFGDTNAVEHLEVWNNTDGKVRAVCVVSGSTQWVVETDSAIWANGESTWKHIVLTQNGTAPIIYVDGVAPAQTFSTSTDKTAWFIDLAGVDNARIGCRNYNSAGNSTLYNGSICQVGIWSRALSASEVQGIMYKQYSDLGSVDKASLVSWWSLSDESLGDELVTNGTFDSDYSSWTEVGTFNPEIEEGMLKGVGVAGQYMKQTISVSELKAFTISLYGKEDAHIKVKSGGVWVVDDETFSALGETKEFTFNVSADLDVRLQLGTGGGTHTAYFDNVSIKELTLDDAHSTNHGSPVGSTTNSTIYGDNAPQIPRILDVAQPKQAVQLADGSTSFDGTDDYIDLGVSPRALVGSSSAFSVSAWINMDDDTNEYICGAMESGAERFYFRVVDNSGTGYMKWGYGDTASSDQLAPISLNQWHYVVWTYDTTNAKVYVDGSLKYTTAVSGKTITNTDNLYIGALNNNGSVTNYLDGSLANVSIHSSALTQSQVQELMFTEKYAGLTADLKTNLVSWYDLGDTSLGSEMYNATTGWTVYGSNTIATDGLDFDLTYVDSSSGMFGRYNNNILTGNVSTGVQYEVSFDAYYTGGSAPIVRYYTDAYTTIATLTTTSTNYTYTHTASDSTNDFINFKISSGSVVSVRNFSVKEIQVEDLEGSNDGSIYGATTTTGYTSSPHGVVDPINYGTLKSGTAVSFDGTNDYVDIDTVISDISSDTTGTIYWSGIVNDFTTNSRKIWSFNDTDASEYLFLGISSTDYKFYGYCTDAGTVQWGFTSSNTFSEGVRLDVAMVHNGTTPSLYVNGVSEAISFDISTDITSWFQDLAGVDNGRIGCVSQNSAGNANFSEITTSNFRIFGNTVLTESEIQEMYLNPEQILPTGVSSSNLKLYLPMNEGDGTYTYDGSGNQNHGTISGATWDTANTDIAQVGLVRQNKPMIFDGSDDVVSISDNSAIDFGTGDFTLSAWIKTSGDGWMRIVDKRDASSGYTFNVDTSERIHLELNDGGGNTGYSASTDISDDLWHHIVASADRSGNVTFYLDGSSDGTADISAKSGSIDSTSDLFIGADAPSGIGLSFDGNINEVAIWDEALDADAVTALYNSGTPLDATTDSGNYDNSDRLQGYWRNDNDTTWTDRANTGVASFDGTDDVITVTAPSFPTGNESRSMALWVKTTDSASALMLVGYGNDASIEMFCIGSYWGTVKFFSYGDDFVGSTAVNDGLWHHLVVTHNATDNVTNLYVDGDFEATDTGVLATASGKDFLVGKYPDNAVFAEMDASGTHVFDVALTSAEVSELYAIDKRSSISGHSQFGNCVGSWLMGAGSGDTTSTIQDQTSENNDATVSGATLVGYNDGTVSDTSVASIVLTEGITSGRDSQGFYLKDTTENCLTLNGAEYVEVPDSEVLSLTTSATWELWMNQSVIDLKQAVISKDTSTTNLISFYTWDDGNFYFDIRDGSTQYGYFNYSTAISADAWHHLTVVFDGSLSGNANRLKVYVDSVQQTLTFSGTMPSTLPTVASPQMIGNMNSSWTTTGLFNGKIDDVRIYSDALSSDEVTKNYNAGLSKHRN